jgi:4-hydroxy-tetrahydrodipicolinate reductase
MGQLKIVQYGVGPIGSEIVKLLIRRRIGQLVGAIDIDRSKVERDLGDIAGVGQKLGVKISSDAHATLSDSKPDIVIHCTSSSLVTVAPQIIDAVNFRSHVISTTEELAFPFIKHPEIAAEIDRRAKEAQVAVLGTGVNPGFVMDTLALALSVACQSINAVKAERVVDASQRRLPLQKKIGAGLDLKEFKRRAGEGSIRHVGLSESVYLIAYGLGWRLSEVSETLEPVIAERDLTTQFLKVKKGDAAGVSQTAIGKMNGREVITLNLRMYIGANDPHDSIKIEGAPPIDMAIRGGIHGDLATAAIVTNMIPKLIRAQPGLRTMADLPLSYAGSL